MILKVNELKKSFGGIAAVDRITLGLDEGEVSAIIGPNGAGKTTLFNLITGKIKPDSGKVFFNAKDITNLPPHILCHKGIGRCFQITNIFPKLTVYENIQVAVLSRKKLSKKPFAWANRMVNEETMEILESLEIASQMDSLGGLLSHGDQKRLDIGIALACRPRLLLLDEPTAGMSPDETHRTTRLIKRLARDWNLTVLLIEHDMSVVFSISELIRVMHLGKLMAEGPPDEIRNNDEVQRIYLGEQEWTC
jgi:branched-chain amino acid transport system ATP-binding protein